MDAPILKDFKIDDLIPLAYEKVMEDLHLPPGYEIIQPMSRELSGAYHKMGLGLDNLESLVIQISEGKLDLPLKKYFETLKSNYHFPIMDFSQFRQLVVSDFQETGRLEPGDLKAKIETFQAFANIFFGNIRKIIESKRFEVKDEKMIHLYPQALEAYERALMWIDEKHADNTLKEKMAFYLQLTFPKNEEELQGIYEKNRSLLEAVIAVQKIENIAIFTRMLTEGANIDVSTLTKESLVNWRNEVSEITRQAKDEKRIQKEEAKKKKIPLDEPLITLLFNDIVPRLLQKKNLKTILMEIKGNFTSPQSKIVLGQLLQVMQPIEQDFIDILFAEDGKDYYKNFDENEQEENSLLYFAILYKALIENQIDFLVELIKNHTEHYLLRIGVRKLFLIKIYQNSRIKNPVGENRVISAFLNSFEKMILNDSEDLKIRNENLIQFSRMIITGFPDLSENLNTSLSDLFIKIYSEILDINLFNKFVSLKKLTEKESDKLELLKNGFKLYEAIVKGLSNNANKPRDQARRNEFVLAKMERKLAGNVKKIKSKSITLN